MFNSTDLISDLIAFVFVVIAALGILASVIIVILREIFWKKK